MKHLQIILFAATMILFAACEKIEDDRNIPVPDNPGTAWLLSVEVDQLPSDVKAYSCAVFNIENVDDKNIFTRVEIKLPELLKIPGAKYLGTRTLNNDRRYSVSFFKINTQTTDSTELLLHLTTIVVPTCSELLSGKEYPQKISFNDAGVKGYLHIRYDYY